MRVFVLTSALAGSPAAMSQETIVPHPGTADTVATVHPIPGSYRVQFRDFAFGAICYSTRHCRVIFAGHNFTRLSMDTVTAPSSGQNYRDAWGDASYAGLFNFPKPAVVEWTSMDGVQHKVEVDIGAIFKDQWALNNVPAADALMNSTSPVGPLVTPSIFLEVNDRTLNVYTKSMIFTRSEQEPGNKYSDFRDDLILVWTHTY
jgi:hypothetical protein